MIAVILPSDSVVAVLVNDHGSTDNLEAWA